jgi:hypothetical protein
MRPPGTVSNTLSRNGSASVRPATIGTPGARLGAVRQ